MISALPTLLFSVQLLSVETPDPRIQRALESATHELNRPVVACSFTSDCDDAAITALAQIAIGHLKPAGGAVARDLRTISLGLYTFHSFLAATNNRELLAERWDIISDEFTSSFMNDTLGDAGIRMASLEAMVTLAGVAKDNRTLDLVRRLLPATEQRLAQTSSLFGLAFGLYEAPRADTLLDRMMPYVRAAWPIANGLAVLAHYEYHRDSTAFALFQQLLETESSTPEMFVLPFVRGLIGWETDAANRAAALEPHLPEAWSTASFDNLVLGDDEIGVNIRRERGTYSIHVIRARPGKALSLRIAPALPKGSRVRHVTINENDVPVQVETNEHDVHVVVEMTLRREAHIEIEYEPPRKRASLR